MSIRANQFRAVLIPAGVALISIGVLAWYGMYWIPAKQRYLDERNVRLLRSIGAQIKVKVNNFDQAIDNAIESIDPGSRGISKFQAYVKLFTPDLEIVNSTDAPPELGFGDPPRVKVVLDEGRHYLYLGYEHRVERSGGEPEKKQVIARADIEAAVGTYLSSHQEFDAIALLDHNGRAMVQQSTTGVEIANLDTTGAPATKRQRRDSAGDVENVRIGGADYRFYIQPVQLSLLREKAAGDDPEEWRLCGLVRADHFRSASAEISSTYWLLLLATLAVLLLAIPILKLHVVHPRERYHGVDGVAAAVSSFLLAGLLTFALLDAFYFGYRSDHESDARLSPLARDLNTTFANEVHAASQELDVQVNALDSALRRTTVSDTGQRYIRVFEPNTLRCATTLVCRTDVLLVPSATAEGRYPYYRLVTWSDSIGRQRYKWTTSRTVTPFINISALPYVDDARRARRLRYDSTVAQGGVSVIRSPNTGEALTVIWSALRPGEPEGLRLASLVTTPISVTHPVLTWGVQFAVVDLTGQVLYHSDSARSLSENFFQETMDNGAVRAAVAGRKKESLSAEYFGRPYRMYVQPIELSPRDTLADPRWSLIVFEQGLIPETVNLEALTLAALMFAAYSLLLAIGWGVAHWAWPRGTDKWFWPNARRKVAYRGVTAVNALLGLAFLFVVVRRSPLVLLSVTLVMSLIAFTATFCIVRYGARIATWFVRRLPGGSSVGQRDKNDDKTRQPESPSEGQRTELRPRDQFHWFLTARVSFLFVVGVVPAMAVFQVAEGYERGLLVRRRSMHATSELDARTARIVRQQRSLRLCPAGEGCPEATAFLQERRKHLAYEVTFPATDTTPGQSSGMISLASTLVFGHRAYNNVAVDLRAAMPGDPAGTFQPYVGYVVLGAFLALFVTFVVRKLVWPLYALDLYWPPGFGPSLGHKPSGNVLLVGSAGSGNNDVLLRRTPGPHDFDPALVGVGGGASLGSSASQAVPVARAPAGGAIGVDSLNAYALSEGDVVATDQLEYPMNDPMFRELMLPVLENPVYRPDHNVWIKNASALVEPPKVDPPIADPVELIRALTTEPPPSREDVLFEFGVAAESYYRALFATCSMDQQLALYQLAETGVVNPRNQTVVAQLMRTRLVVRDPTFRVMNETFRRFIEREMSHESAAEREHEGVRLPWGSISTMMLTTALLPLGVLLLTQQQLPGAWAGILPTLTPMLPSVVKLISAAPLGGKRGAVPV